MGGQKFQLKRKPFSWNFNDLTIRISSSNYGYIAL